MKVEINETYIECDICKKKIKPYHFFKHIYQIKVKSVQRNGIKPYLKIDLCSNCYCNFVTLIRDGLKEAEDNHE